MINILEFNWLTRYPWPTEIVMDRGKEFQAEVSETLHHEYGIKHKIITTCNCQANSMVEQVHQTVHNLIQSMEIRGKQDFDMDFRWSGLLSAVRQAVIGTVHTTNQATPSQLVLGRDAILNVGFQANWEYLRLQKLKQIKHNNLRENAKRIPHQYAMGDEVMI